MNWDQLGVSRHTTGMTHCKHSRVADDPSVQARTPRSSQHDQTQRHDQRVLHQSESSSDPVTLESNQHLAHHDTDDLQVVDGRDPVLVAHFVRAPARGPDGLVQRRQVADGEEPGVRRASTLRLLDSRVTLGEETETAHDVSLRVRAQRRERVLLEHAHDVVPLALGLGVALRVDPFLALAEGQVRLGLAFLDCKFLPRNSPSRHH